MSRTDVKKAVKIAVEEHVLPKLLRIHAPPLLDAAKIRLLANMVREQDDAVQLAADLAAIAAPAAGRDAGAGVSLETLCLEVLAPIARELGACWDRDEIGSEEVTLGVGRLHAILRSLQREARTVASIRASRILMMPAPGESHRFGLSVAAALFRNAGWVARIGEFEGETQLDALLDQFVPDMVGFSVSCGRHLSGLASAISAMRRIRPAVPVVAGGPVFADKTNLNRRLRLDAVLTNGATAPLEAASLLRRWRSATPSSQLSQHPHSGNFPDPILVQVQPLECRHGR